MVHFRHLEKILGKEVVDQFLPLGFCCLQLIHYVAYGPRSSHSKTFLQVIQVQELAHSFDLALFRAQSVKVVEITKNSELRLSTRNLSHLLFDVASSLLSHHGIVTFIDRHGTVV